LELNVAEHGPGCDEPKVQDTVAEGSEVRAMTVTFADKWSEE
jgi:hypothetical protein